MGTSLTGLTPSTTYDALIKVGDNGALSATAKVLSDGLGNDSPLAMSTTLVGIGTATPTTTLDVEGTSFLRGNVNAGKTANINVTTSVNGTGGGNREFTTFTGASATGFTGTDSSDQGYGYFACTIVSGRSYEMSTTIVVTNGAPLSFITSTGRNFATDTVQTVTSSPVSNTTFRFVASGNASFFGVSASNSGGGMTCVVSNFSIKEVGSVLVAYDSNVGIGTTLPTGKLTISQANSGGVAAILLSEDESTIQGPSANTYLKMGSNMGLGAAGVIPILIANTEVLRVTANGLTFNGDTAAANALDDYEEGTWTMGVSFGNAAVGVTYVLNTGVYTKIGRQVTVNGYMALSSKGSSAGNARITGLPFTIANASNNYGAASLWLQNVSFVNQYSGISQVGTTNMEFFETTSLGVLSALTDTDFANNSEVIVSLTYFV